MRRFKYLGPTIDARDGHLKTGDIVEYDGQNDTPDGGIPGEHWVELEDEPALDKVLPHG